MFLVRVCLMGMLSVSVWAQITTRGALRPVHMDAGCDKAGVLRFIVENNPIPAASVAAPVFIRFTLAGDARLCQTLVWSHPSQSEQAYFAPIYMRLSTLGHRTEATMIAPPDSLAVVRWKQGERSIWLRVNTPTDAWMLIDGMPATPNARHPVYFYMGYPAGSFSSFGLEPIPAANRSATSRASVPTSVQDIQPLLFCMDMALTNLVENQAFNLQMLVLSGLAAHGASSPVDAEIAVDIPMGTALDSIAPSTQIGRVADPRRLVALRADSGVGLWVIPVVAWFG